ncbi:glycerol kinase GlpK [Parasphingorhabdus halotolerans]|uniref:Glycerol kinase GlpK n=1 Tax=Parasphingorhabdus halotolerans TaxID=2725558 RepID=A0A6H2DIG7_9SPHN|nr:glycerol kinase GlpK [Parasphingorhabdus halotolerans]QJB68462.1 glycerol kinase GlpK [Parasphingorhabdus halotolerans]
MSAKQILVIDEGTTSTRAMLFGCDGKLRSSQQEALQQYYPSPGLVEHDATEIWEKTLRCCQKMVEQAGGADKIAAIGITNQRETVVAWDKRSGEPLCKAIVWQDRRTAEKCDALKDKGLEPLVQQKTGLLLDPYFSGSKIGWMLENVPEVKAAGDNLAFGTIESYLIFRLTGGIHITDASNASRTMLMPLNGQVWDDELLDLFDIPKAALPNIVDCAGDLGATLPTLFGSAIPICGSAGDQQAATIGQACFAMGQTKATFGTGAFILTNSGDNPPKSENRLLSTVLYQLNGERTFALEGSVFVAGSLMQWLRDDVGLIEFAGESEELARSVANNGGVYLVPALSGLGAPHWRADATCTISGLSFSATKAHIVRAALESIAHQCHDLKTAFSADGTDWESLRIDGGMVANDWMVQDLADVLNIPVERPEFIETTALGAAMLAAVGCGIYETLDDASAMISGMSSYEPSMDSADRAHRLAGWQKAIAGVLAN